MYYLELILLLFILIILIIISYLYFLSLINNIKYKVPQVSTFNSDLKILRESFKKYNLEWKKIVDLWSGIWKIMRLLEKEYKANVTWYEIDYSNVLIAKILNKFFNSRWKIIKWNYFEADLRQYDFIYIYLFPELMEKVEEKIFSSAKKWTIVFVNSFKLIKHKPIEIFYKNGKEKIFIYKI